MTRITHDALRLALCGLVLAAAGCACDRRPKVVLELADPFLRELTREDLPRLERHLRASPRWEVREEGGHVFAVRRERQAGVCEGCELPGGFRSSVDGFYGDHRAQELMRTRVRLVIGEPPPAEAEHVQAIAGQGEVVLRPSRGAGDAGFVTWLRVSGAGGAIFLEVTEEAKVPERRFTRAVLAQVQGELARALEEPDALDRDGYVAALWPDGAPPRGIARLEVAESARPGSYVVTGWANPGEKGRAFLRSAGDGTPPVDELRERSTRLTGWSTGGEALFPYQAELALQEGEGVPGLELILLGDDGSERTLARTREIVDSSAR